MGKSEKDEQLREKLERFKQKESENRLIKLWNSAEELPSLVALSLSKTIKTYPAIGWIRANSITNPEILQELNELRKENQDIKDKINELNELQVKKTETVNLASLDDEIIVFGTNFSAGTGGRKWETTVTWGEIFSLLSPHLLAHPNDAIAKTKLSGVLFEKVENKGGYHPEINDKVYQTIKVHLNTLGLIDLKFLKSTKGGMSLFWTLTEKGEELMSALRSVKKN